MNKPVGPLRDLVTDEDWAEIESQHRALNRKDRAHRRRRTWAQAVLVFVVCPVLVYATVQLYAGTPLPPGFSGFLVAVGFWVFAAFQLRDAFSRIGRWLFSTFSKPNTDSHEEEMGLRCLVLMNDLMNEMEKSGHTDWDVNRRP